MVPPNYTGHSSKIQRSRLPRKEVAARVGRSGELVGDISAASAEQAEGIEQVNKAVSEMDKVVEQNAGNAEESASASEEMNAQAVRMKDIVAELKSLVDGSKNNSAVKGSVLRDIRTTENKTAKNPQKDFCGICEPKQGTC